MRTEFPLLVRLGIALAVIAAIIGVVGTVIVTSTAAEGQQFTATFGRAGQGLNNMSPVKIRGVTVGQVRSVSLNDKGRAVVAFQIDDQYRIPRGATAAVEPLSAFGPKMLHLKMEGVDEKAGPFLASGDSVAKTEDPADLTDTLGESHQALENIDPKKAASIQHSLAQGLRGEGENLRKIIDNSEKILGVVDKHQKDNDTYGVVSSLSGARGTPGESSRAFVGTSGDLNDFIPPVADESDNLNKVLDRITTVSATADGGLNRHWDDIGRGFRSSERLTELLSSQLDKAGTGVRGIDHSVKVLQDSARIPGPSGTALLGAQAWLHPDPCKLIVDLCGPGGEPKVGE